MVVSDQDTAIVIIEGVKKGVRLMEQVTMQKNSKKYGFNKGDKFVVKRTVMGECVVIVPNGCNIIMSERKLRSYGSLVGKPQVG